MSQQNKPSIILINPQMGENIGASARAMLNCGLNDLRIVNPRDGWPNDKAISNSAGAIEKMPEVQVFANTEKALEEFNYIYATTARPRDMVKPVFTANKAAQDMYERASNGQKIAILFGGERAGLSNEDISHANAIISVPLNPEFSSLNLAQGVLICAYEWSQAHNDKSEPHFTPQGNSFPVSKKDFDNFIKRLENELEQHNFFQTANMQPSMMRNIRALFSRSEMTDQETRTLQGIVSALIGNKTDTKI